MKREYIFGLLAFAFLILAGCANKISPEEYVSKDSDLALRYNGCVESCGRCEENCNDMFFNEVSAVNMDITLCDNVKDKITRENCKDSFYMVKAVTEKDSAYCERIANDGIKTGCFINVIKEDAVSKKDPNLCNTLAENARECKIDVVFTLVQQTGDKSYCNRLEGESKETCLEN